MNVEIDHWLQRYYDAKKVLEYALGQLGNDECHCEGDKLESILLINSDGDINEMIEYCCECGGVRQ